MTVGIESAKMLQKASKTVLLLVTALLCSCGEVLFHEFHSVEGRKWSRGNVLSYCYDGSLTTADDAGYLLSVEARTDVSYSYKNLVVRVETFDGEGGELLSADTLCCSVYADDGRSEGSTAGVLYQVGSEEAFIAKGTCDTVVMRLSHIMESEELCGVSDVGIRLCSSVHGQHQSSGM